MNSLVSPTALRSMPDNPFTLIVTSIFPPTPAMEAHARGATETGARIVVAGDQKGPDVYELPQTTFLSLETQREFSALGDALPTDTYTRKNVAYLWAIADGASVIVETDDDNAPMADFFSHRGRELLAQRVTAPRWFNAYSAFTQSDIWPRGMPLESLTSSERFDFSERTEVSISAPVQQGLADGDPDVDAVYRMTRELPITFDQGRSIVLSAGTWCPFNSQNTTWFPEAYPLLYLPSHCSFRMTDIWRSFVAQRVAWENGWEIDFTSPNVFQHRNEHNLLADFGDEVPGYLHNDLIARTLESIDLPADDLAGGMTRCYEAMIELGVVGKNEMDLLELWLSEVSV